MSFVDISLAQLESEFYYYKKYMKVPEMFLVLGKISLKMYLLLKRIKKK
jgi:hypothetical protein